MRYGAGLVAVVLAGACGGTQQQPERLSVGENLAEAERHDREATRHERDYARIRQAEGGRIQCYDQRTADPSSGGEPVRVLRPCWTREEPPSRHHLDEARAQREEAARHRAVAASLLRAERSACKGLGEDEMSHSPFYHREDILRVDEVRVDGELHGARVLFAKVPGLNAGWLRRAIACHQARAAAMGYPTREMSYCPLMAAPTSATVEEYGGTIAVTVIARRDWEIAALVGRAKALVAAAQP
ncbi:MAG TPA: hypothetical protein VFU21_30010 [Kofleriaceae bacterium]|nr:hypothetical protein [Kofleriaceae bacterium]